MRLFPQIISLAFASFAAVSSAAVSFRAEIAPLLQRHCSTCHCEDNSKGKYRIDTFDLLLKPGDSEDPSVVPGKPQDSELYQRLIETDPTDRMPQKADALQTEEIARVEQWIREGAQFDGDARDRPLVELARESLLHPAPERYSRPLPVTALAFSPDGNFIVASGYYEVTLWRISDGALIRRIGGLPERIVSLAWDADHNLLAVAGGTPGQWGTIALVDPDAGKVRYLCDMPETALCLAFKPGGSILAAGGGDRTVRLFEIPSGKQTHLLRQNADWVQTIAFNDDGSKFVTASRDRTSRIFDTATGELESSYTGHEAPLVAALFVEGSKILSVDRAKSAQIWDYQSRQKTADFKGFDGDLREMAFWDDKLVTAGLSPTILIQQFSDRQRLYTLYGHRESVNALALSPDRALLASGSADGEVFIWELYSGTWIRRFTASPAW